MLGPVNVVAENIDSLYLSYDFDVPMKMRRALERAKGEAESAKRLRSPDVSPTDVAAGAMLQLGPLDCEVRPYGAKSAPFLLASPDATLAVCPDNAHGPTVMVQVLAEALWREGPARVVELSDFACRELAGGGLFEHRRVSRVDFAVDFQGWVPLEAEFQHFVRKGKHTRLAKYQPGAAVPLAWDVDDPRAAEEAARRDAITEWYENQDALDRAHYFRHKYTGLRAGGSGPVAVRVYDKSEEIRHSGKAWFRDVWGARGADLEQPVWRAEAQVRREALGQNTEGGYGRGKDRVKGQSKPLTTPEDVFSHSGEIWRYVMEDWLRLTIPTYFHASGKKMGELRLTRCETHPAWAQLAAWDPLNGDVGETKRITRERQVGSKAELLIPPMVGYWAAYAALTGKAQMHDAVEAAELKGKEHLEARGTTFPDHVELAKRRRVTAVAEWALIEEHARRELES